MRSRRPPRISSTPPSMRPTRRPRRSRAGGQGARASSSTAAAADGGSSREPDPDAADVGLVGEPDGVELEDDGAAQRSRAAATAAVGRRRPTAADDRHAGGRQRAEALALAAACRGSPRSRAAAPIAPGSWPNERPVGGERRPASSRTGPRVRRRSRAASQRATAAIAVNASTAPRRTGTPPALASASTISGVGSPDVSETKTGRRSGRSAVARSERRSTTSSAVSTSDGSERYGKSWTSARTS